MSAGPSGDAVTLTAAEGMALATAVLSRHGFAPDEAAAIANHLVEAELHGHSTTGLARLAALVRMGQRGRAPVRVVREGPAFAHIDGGGTPGSYAAEVAVKLAVAKARETGLAVVGLHNSAQAGILGHYVRIAAEAGFVGALFCSSYPRVAPHGGIDPVIGTNPIAFGFPGEEAVVVDVSTSAVTNGDVAEARREGRDLPEGAALDAEGRPTTDPARAADGALLPVAGHKGYAIGLAMQLFGVLVGGDPVPENRGNFGFFFLVVDPALFGAGDGFRGRVEEVREAVKGSRRTAGTEEILLPGEGSRRRRERSLAQGFPINRALLRELRDL